VKQHGDFLREALILLLVKEKKYDEAITMYLDKA